MRDSGGVRLVELARAGDIEAFARLVDEFQDVVMGLAYGWLGDVEAARDVSQEVFLDAYVCLEQLREPAAFPAWLRRIVHKHCDRATRRRRPDQVALDEDAAAAAEHDAVAADTGQRLRAAVSSLPADERIVVALHYFAGLTGPELAAFLDLSLPTVKKRLRSARSTLREQGDRLMDKALGSLRPSNTGDFADEVAFFVAIRAGDRARVSQMLARTPELVNAVQAWEARLVTQGVLPFANRATALITAVERNDLPLLVQLLDAGADVDGVCGCVTGESPVWAATVLDRLRHLRVLLARGSNPNRTSCNGNTPLHVAAMRGNRAAAELLLAHAADTRAEDREGRTPADWARINGHTALAAVLGPDPAAPEQPGRRPPLAADASSPSDGPPAAQHERAWFTGIKALDLFCPLPLGGLVRVPFMAGAGMVVLLGELCRRITLSPRGRAVWSGFSQRPFDLKDWDAEMAELGLTGYVQRSLADVEASPDAQRSAFLRGVDLAETLCDAGHHVLLVLTSHPAFESDLDSSFARLVSPRRTGSLTTLHVTAFPERAEAAWPRVQPPYSAQVKLHRAIARRGIFPALDPVLSHSTGGDSVCVGPAHASLAREARTVLADYLARDPGLDALAARDVPADHHPGDGDPAALTVAVDQDAPARRLIRYFAQPFYVAEPFSGRPATWIGQAELLASVQAILQGRERPG